jgi:hypothetical protein
MDLFGEMGFISNNSCQYRVIPDTATNLFDDI